MDYEYKERLLQLAKQFYDRGPGFAQEMVVLREAAEKFKLKGDKQGQQRLLTAWHDLFLERKLSWGYDIDNPASPFFHLVEPSVSQN